jgi:hypothetical protein
VVLRWPRRSLPPHLAEARRAFQDTVRGLDGARELLWAAVPGGRGSAVPLAEALAAFERELGTSVRGSLDAWRVPEVLPEWEACLAAVEEATRRAESLRLGDAPSESYEEVYGPLGDVLEPLEAFAAAAEAFRRVGRRAGAPGRSGTGRS